MHHTCTLPSTRRLIKFCQNIMCMHSHSLVVYTASAHLHAEREIDTHTHTEGGISRHSLLCEVRGSVTDPSVQNKDLSSAVILSLQTRGFCMGLAEPGLRLLFIYFICYQGLGKHNVPLVRRSTMCYNPPSDGFLYSDPVPL